MAKSMRSKRKRRLRTLRREIAEPFYDKKEQAKLAAQEAALAAPKLEIPLRRSQMEIEPANEGGNEKAPMAIDSGDMKNSILKPVGGIQKKRKNKLVAKQLRKKRRKNKKHNF
ncbi:hypothetical protein SUGI_1144640 [Cryptomeria japonica]|uniref:uncharacterized protein LOC131069661 n=1 Tax=Cryptomeria japonica TaxID=3369 RepID=UPI002414A726|nr:uncharacterized protein LOC131069661 [Cryptomeria japonica]GLJ53663.1 hypothetical protein SUGI_1144640 [Cryptomeria japonica]